MRILILVMVILQDKVSDFTVGEQLKCSFNVVTNLLSRCSRFVAGGPWTHHTHTHTAGKSVQCEGQTVACLHHHHHCHHHHHYHYNHCHHEQLTGDLVTGEQELNSGRWKHSKYCWAVLGMAYVHWGSLGTWLGESPMRVYVSVSSSAHTSLGWVSLNDLFWGNGTSHCSLCTLQQPPDWQSLDCLLYSFWPGAMFFLSDTKLLISQWNCMFTGLHELRWLCDCTAAAF